MTGVRAGVTINGAQTKLARLLKTGQTTQYSSELDDGFYEAGIAKSYTVLTTGQYSGTTNVDLIHYTAATLAFVSATKKITDSANGLAIFKTGDIIVITGSTSNNGAYTVATGNVAGEIVTTEALTDELAGASVSIAKREAKSNNCVVDNNTGLMWLRDPSNYPAKMGAASNGRMEWTGTPYDIFAYCAACNAAAVGGYTDWRVANRFEIHGLTSTGALSSLPDVTAFPNVSVTYHWSSSTAANESVSAIYTHFLRPISYLGSKGVTYAAMLVRGGL